MGYGMTTPDRDSLADGLVSIGEEAIAKRNDASFYDYYTDHYQLHSPAGAFNREEIRSYFAALRASFTDFTISRAQVLVDGNFVTARRVQTDTSDFLRQLGAVGS
jgi:predicted SnoaL-like aldol condensation-catalyzing enzyme